MSPRAPRRPEMAPAAKAATSRAAANVYVTQFENFFEGWLVRQEHFLDELLSTLQHCPESREEDLRDLIARVLAHYQQYYEEKSRVANRDVFLVFSPPWFSPFEQTFFWIAGFKPGLAFRLATRAVDDMTAEQRRRMERLKEETSAEEKELSDEMARIQESLAGPPLLEMLVRRRREGAGGVDGDVAGFEGIRAAMEGVLSRADMLRTMTAERVVEVLTPRQNVRFLVAVTELQLRIRRWGMQIECERGSGGHQGVGLYGGGGYPNP